jgi:hypothetical protein
MWLPGWLYVALPYICASTGGIALKSFDSLLGHASGTLLLFTGCMIWMMRWNYRQGKNKSIKTKR